MPIAYIGLGSNLDDPPARVRRAIDSIRHLPETLLLASSSCYRSNPVGPPGQPDYINAVVKVETGLDALQLLARLKEIEDGQGRVRAERWGPRTLDLDLLLYNDLVMVTASLTLPHAEMHKRGFVLYPLHELEPDLVIPGRGAVRDLIRNLDPAQCRKQDNP